MSKHSRDLKWTNVYLLSVTAYKKILYHRKRQITEAPNNHQEVRNQHNRANGEEGPHETLTTNYTYAKLDNYCTLQH